MPAKPLFAERILDRWRNFDFVKAHSALLISVTQRYGFALTLGIAVLIFIPIARTRLAYKTLRKRRPSIVWGPTPIMNIAHNAELDRSMGYSSETLVYSVYYITHAFDHNLMRFVEDPNSRYILPHLTFLNCLWRYDIFHFYYDWGIWDWADLVPRAKRWEYRILNWAGKKVVLSAYGADVRYRTLTEQWDVNLCQECPPELVGRACICKEDKALSRYFDKRKYVTKCLSMGDMLEYTPGSDNSVFYWPVNTTKWRYVGVRKSTASDPLVVVHAPNHQHFKGTKYLVAAVDTLRNEGLNIQLKLVQGVPNAEAQKIYASADVVAAQFVLGWHGYFELEAMALGKPVMTAIQKREWLLAPEECPMILCKPWSIAEELRALYYDREKCQKLGELGRKYIVDHFSFSAAAIRFQKLYDEIW